MRHDQLHAPWPFNADDMALYGLCWTTPIGEGRHVDVLFFDVPLSAVSGIDANPYDATRMHAGL
jgi:hypothetical protein